MRGFKGGMFGGDFRMGRKFAAGDLQLVILALLDEQPRHGYELIKLLEERSGGFYVPSPGVIYPALTYLEETGLAEVEAEGAKKLYRITEAGRGRVEENRPNDPAYVRQAGTHRREDGPCEACLRNRPSRRRRWR